MQRVLEEYERRQGQDGEHVDAGELEAVAGSLTGAGNDRERATFASFQARVDGAPGQVLRYCFQDGAEPLWPSRRNLPDPAGETRPARRGNDHKRAVARPLTLTSDCYPQLWAPASHRHRNHPLCPCPVRRHPALSPVRLGPALRVSGVAPPSALPGTGRRGL